jgi:YD repeat-containing protein
MLGSGLLWGASALHADQARYFYDELGRLIGVVDGQNNAAVYNYDDVGNLLKIDRFNTAGGNVGIFLIAPSSSLVNKPVEIRGFGFTSPPSSNTVTFNGTAASVLSGTSDSLIVTVPSAATTGPVSVTNATGTATSPQAFKVFVPPIITGVDPSKAPKGVVTRLSIQGFNLKTASSVQFTQAGLSATIASGATDDKLPINLTVGAAVPNGDYPFSVTTPSGTAQSGTIRISVTPAFPGFNTTKPLTIQMPLNTSVPATAAPTGPAASTTTPTTVQMPLDTTVPVQHRSNRPVVRCESGHERGHAVKERGRWNTGKNRIDGISRKERQSC